MPIAFIRLNETRMGPSLAAETANFQKWTDLVRPVPPAREPARQARFLAASPESSTMAMVLLLVLETVLPARHAQPEPPPAARESPSA